MSTQLAKRTRGLVGLLNYALICVFCFFRQKERYAHRSEWLAKSYSANLHARPVLADGSYQKRRAQSATLLTIKHLRPYQVGCKKYVHTAGPCHVACGTTGNEPLPSLLRMAASEKQENNYVALKCVPLCRNNCSVVVSRDRGRGRLLAR